MEAQNTSAYGTGPSGPAKPRAHVRPIAFHVDQKDLPGSSTFQTRPRNRIALQRGRGEEGAEREKRRIEVITSNSPPLAAVPLSLPASLFDDRGLDDM